MKDIATDGGIYELLALHLHRDIRDGSWYAVRVERRVGTEQIRHRVVLEIDFDALRREIEGCNDV